MQDQPAYEYQTIRLDEIKYDLKPYIDSENIDLIVKNLLISIGNPVLENCSIRYYVTFIKPKLIELVQKQNIL